MRFREIITEGASVNLLIVDVQPEYNNWCSNILPGVQQLIEKCKARVVIVYNDFGGGDEMFDVQNYLGGVSEEDMYGNYNDETDEYDEPEQTVLQQKLQQATYYQKEFGFLRPFMDQAISDAVIIEVLREMYQRKVTDSRSMELDSMSERVQHEIDRAGIGWDDEGIYLQDWLPITMLKQLSPFYMVGGGRNECLREIELICNAFNIRYTRINSLIY